ncbi:MAG: sulfurtransferase [Betaproteobacteria bacterium]
MDYTTLLPAEILKGRLGDPGWVILDVRHDLFDLAAGRRAYEAGHVPGAQFASIDHDLSGAKTGRNGRHPLPARDALVTRFRAWGIGNDSQIVAYDAQGGQFAARLWWLARWLGHRRVAVLDGGWPAWLAAGGSTETVTTVRAPGNFSAGASLASVVTADELLAVLDRTDRLLLDARMPERYRGEQEPIDPVAGHIPGALNRPWQHNLAPDQRFKSPAELKADFTALLVGRPSGAATHQCGSGVTACHNVLAMEVAGLPGSALYAGSWSEWIADRARPIRTGAEP